MASARSKAASAPSSSPWLTRTRPRLTQATGSSSSRGSPTPAAATSNEARQNGQTGAHSDNGLPHDGHVRGTRPIIGPVGPGEQGGPSARGRLPSRVDRGGGLVGLPVEPVLLEGLHLGQLAARQGSAQRLSPEVPLAPGLRVHETQVGSAGLGEELELPT